MPGSTTIRADDPSGTAVAALLALHLAEMARWSPPGSVHALPAESLRAPGISFYTAWRDDALAGCGALRELDPGLGAGRGHGEIKSMRVADAWRGMGVGRAILAHLLAVARDRGYARASLETGRAAPFAPALGLYRANGFVECPPFADYVADGFSICMTKRL